MIVVMEAHAPEPAIEAVVAHLVGAGFAVHRSSGSARTILGVVGDLLDDDLAVVRELTHVANVVRVTEPFPRVARAAGETTTILEGAWGRIGGAAPWVAIEPVSAVSGAAVVRPAGPSPFDAAFARGAAANPEVDLFVSRLDGDAPRFVERPGDPCADAWLAVADEALARGATNLVLLETGARAADGERALDVAALARLRERTRLPIVVDVPTIAGHARRVAPVALAAIAAGADGAILRVRPSARAGAAAAPAALAWDEAAALVERLTLVASARR